MTSILGILCSDGVVIGSDSASTLIAGASPTIQQETNKIEIFDNKVIVVGTGEVGLGQRFCHIAEVFFKDGSLNKKAPIDVMTLLSKNTIQNFQSTYTSFPNLTPGFRYGAIVAYTDGTNFSLCEFDPIHFRPELKMIQKKLWFTSMGCGQNITDPFLGMMRKIFWRDNLPTVADAMFITTWTLEHAIELNPGGIDAPIQMAAIRKIDGRYRTIRISPEDIHEHSDMVTGAENHLADYKNIYLGRQQETQNIPDINGS